MDLRSLYRVAAVWNYSSGTDGIAPLRNRLIINRCYVKAALGSRQSVVSDVIVALVTVYTTCETQR